MGSSTCLGRACLLRVDRLNDIVAVTSLSLFGKRATIKARAGENRTDFQERLDRCTRSSERYTNARRRVEHPGRDHGARAIDHGADEDAFPSSRLDVAHGHRDPVSWVPRVVDNRMKRDMGRM
jgi:hypothetical protein